MEELDRALVERARAGDRRAQEAVVRRYVAPLHALARRVVPSADPDDLAQELLRKILEALPGFDPAGRATLSTWVFTIAHRYLIDVGRRRRLVELPLEAGLQVPDDGPGAERIAGGRQLVGRLESALARIPEGQRRVFVLALVHGQPLESIAEAEGVALGTVKSRLHRARAELASALAEGDGDA